MSAQETDPPLPSTRVYYSVFVQSFCDSNGDGIGDIPGLTSKLDYLKDLGIQGLWLLPVHPSPSYHKYDVTDYYSIHPDYGTLDDYKTLVKEAHKRNMVILLDLVINHTSNRISWFQEASKRPSNPYRDYYVWSDKKADFVAEPFHWHAVRDAQGKQKSGPKYYGFFWWEMPDLNFDSQKVRQEMHKIASFWLKDIGIDGFRLDAAKYIYPENETEKNVQWWNEFRQEALKINDQVIMVGEVWGPAKEIAPYLKKGMTACFNFQLADSIRISLKEEKDHYVLQTWWQIRDTYVQENPSYSDAIFLSNHDINRIMTDIGNKTAKAKVAAALLLTLPGNPFIYYGEEIGMLGEKPDEFIREPFLWNMEGEDKGQTHWEIPYTSTSQTVKPLKYQLEDPTSLYYFYKHLISVRNNSNALGKGFFDPFIQNNRKVIGFYRGYGRERMLILINLSKDIQRIDSPSEITEYKQLTGTHDVFKSGGGAIYLQPYAVFVLSKTS
ncbi:MAG: alpha-amylase family glycosyl hydrolase [Bacteroidales bacterium]|nr:alpha-amylase family glycosyl hydrolase [Bacteroidales bacterium]